MQNRPYQDSAHAAIRVELLKQINRQLIQMATGTGKTVVFSQLPTTFKDVLPGQMLILAHREELVDQAINKLRKLNPTLRIDKEMASHKADPSLADVIVASVATLGRKNNKRLPSYNWSRVDKIVTDEAHHSVADTYMNIYQASGILEPVSVDRLMLGVTATPQRGDGKALAKLYQKISFVYSMRQAIEEGWLVEPHGVRVTTKTSLDKIKTVAGDYDITQLADTVNTPERNQLIVKAWLDSARGRQSIGFTVDIQHAKDLAAMFRHYGVNAEALWGNDPDRAEKLERHRAGEITILLNCGVLTEGYDDWRIGCIILARPTKSSVLFTQMVGRGTRLEELEDGRTPNLLDWTGAPIKRDCLILDIVDASSKHSLITLPTLMGMAASLDLRGQGVVQALKKLEDAQKQFPHINFSDLPDISQLESFIEDVNLFDVRFPEEVESNSELSWHPSPAGGYVLLLPNKDKLTIWQNLLDNYEITGNIRGKKYRGERATIEEAFTAADTLIQNACPDLLKVVRREEAWHSGPATPAQLKLLKKLCKGKGKNGKDREVPADIDKGKASKLISSFLAGQQA